MKTKYERMIFKKEKDKYHKPFWSCTDREHQMLRGEIHQYGVPEIQLTWMLRPGMGMLFDGAGLRDIADFLEQLNKGDKL